MSEENSGVPPKADPNAELLARTEKLAQDNERLSQQLAQVLEKVQASASAPRQVVQAEEEDLEVLAYKDPKRYAAKIAEDTERRVTAAVENRMAAQNQANAVLNQLTTDYPELADSNNELTKKAIINYQSLSEADKRSPMAYKTAVRDAAAELGVLPKAKRSKTNSSEDFSFGGGGSSSGGGSGRGSKEDKLSNATLGFAEAVGLDTSNKEVVERLKKRAERKDWGRYK